MRTSILAAIAMCLAACQSAPHHEPVVQATGAGVTEVWSSGANANAQPVAQASGSVSNATAAAATATAKEKRK